MRRVLAGLLRWAYILAMKLRVRNDAAADAFLPPVYFVD